MKKAALITYEEQAKAYEAMSVLKQLGKTNSFGLKEVAVVQKSHDGTKFSIKDSLDYESGKRIATGSIIGMIVGILGGPLGVLCGWIVGDLAGMGINYMKSKKEITVFDKIAESLAPDEAGLLILMNETNEDLLNTMVVEKLDGKIERFDYEEVKKDVEMAKKHLS